MIQFNLLPDIKIEYIKAKRMKRLVAFVSVIVSSVCIVFFVIIFLLVNVWQKQQMKNLEDKTIELTNKLKETEDIDDILTVQSQLRSIDGLHEQKPTLSKFFKYMEMMKPESVIISSRQLVFAENKVVISGTAPSIEVVREFIDTLKYSEYKLAENAEPAKLFERVELSAFSRTSAEKNPAVFTINFQFKPETLTEKADNIEINVIKTANGGEVDLFELPTQQNQEQTQGGAN